LVLLANNIGTYLIVQETKSPIKQRKILIFVEAIFKECARDGHLIWRPQVDENVSLSKQDCFQVLYKFVTAIFALYKARYVITWLSRMITMCETAIRPKIINTQASEETQ